MIDLASALMQPISKLLLKSWLGDAAAEVGGNLVKYALARLGYREKAVSAQRRANQIASAVIRDLETFFASERVDESALNVAAHELGE